MFAYFQVPLAIAFAFSQKLGKRFWAQDKKEDQHLVTQQVSKGYVLRIFPLLFFLIKFSFNSHTMSLFCNLIREYQELSGGNIYNKS